MNEIMLGFVDTRHGPGTRGWGLLSNAERQAIRDHTLLGRTGTLDDVVKAVMFVLRDAPFMTGSVLRLDGGYRARRRKGAADAAWSSLKIPGNRKKSGLGAAPIRGAHLPGRFFLVKRWWS